MVVNRTWIVDGQAEKGGKYVASRCCPGGAQVMPRTGIGGTHV